MKLKKINKLQIKTIIAAILLTIATSLTIYFLYEPITFNKWPWLQFSLAMSLFTCLWVYTFRFFLVTGGNENTLNPFFYGVVIVPFNLIIVYPTPEKIGLFSDSNISLLIVLLDIIHGIGFWQIDKAVKEYLK